MARTVAIGEQDFETIIQNNYFYIDKTLLIKEWWGNGDNTTLITRPRRFGKTLNISMIEKFFSVDYAGRGELFEKLNIWKEEEYRNLQGTYPVISLSFARVKDKSLDEAIERIREIIKDAFIQKRFLRDNNILEKEDRDYYDKIVSGNASSVEITSGLYHLSRFLCNHYGKKVIILLDEYDTPMQEAYVGGYWDELVQFTRSLFNSTFKTNPYMARSIMTGITRVSKESIFSDLNHLKVITTTSDEYATAFGFTEEEVFKALDEFDILEKKYQVKKWYDGFVFGKYKDIYNPWSIINMLDTSKFDIYWANSSANSLVGKLLREGNSDVKVIFEDLLKGNSLTTEIDEQIVYNQLDNNASAIWSLLLASGYLKVTNFERIISEYDFELKYELTITNFETKKMFEAMVRGWFCDIRYEYNAFIKALLEDDKKSMNSYMNSVALNCFSYFDTGKKPALTAPERFYHGFVLGLLVELQREYIITSNRESGFGRYDVMIEPKNPDKNHAIIIEFKVYGYDDEETLKDTVKIALKQIEQKQYAAQLEARGIPDDRIKKYGFAFHGKEVLIG